MLASQNRGRSAAGMAYMDAKQQVMIRKQEGPAENLVKGMTDANWAEVARSPRALFHARATTKGSEKDNVNNHPVSAYGWVVVHNGHISNDDELFAYYKEKRYAAVDTAAIPLVLKQGTNYEDSIRHLSILAGQVSVAAWSLNFPDKIAIARLGSNDVYLFFDPSRDIIYWCSTPIGGRAIPGFSLGNMAFFTVAKLHENKVLILEPTEERARLFKIERKPFLVPKQYVLMPTPVHTPSSGKTASEAATTVMLTGRPILTGRMGLCGSLSGQTHGSNPRSFEWSQPNEACKTKPGVDVSGIPSEWFEWEQVQGYFRSEYVKHGNIASVFTMPTGYGRWIFNCPNVERFGIFDSSFLPARRIKKFWRRNFDSDIPSTKLPVQLGVLDNKLTLEEFLFTEIVPTKPPGRVHHMGYMCPWCGIVMQTHKWGNLTHRCPACGIVSQPYKSDRKEV